MPSRAFTSVLWIAITCATGLAGTFGKVVVLGGHASDIAFDSRRQQVYVANYTGMRVDVVSADGTLRQPMRVDAVPASIALSPDNRFLVVAHANTPGTFASVTVIDLDRGGRSVLWLPAVPLAVAFGNGTRALIVTNSGLYLLDPLGLSLQPVPAPELVCQQSPVPFGTFPPDITRAAAGVSGDGRVVIVAAEYDSKPATGSGTVPGCSADPGAGNETLFIRYDVETGAVSASGVTAAPPLGPRVFSVDATGSRFLAGWGLLDSKHVLLAQFPYAAGSFSAGGHVFDPVRDVIYAQVPSSAAGGDPDGPVLSILDSDNLTVRERIRLAEDLAGKAVLSSDARTMYAISASGITVLPIGSLDHAPRVYARQEQVFMTVNTCAASTLTQVLDVVDPGEGHTDFTISLPETVAGIRLSASGGTTPAAIAVEIDPVLFRAQPGTTAIPVNIASRSAVNVIPAVRLLVNMREPDQRGTVLPVPGKIVDILGDPARNWVYLLRQDRNQVIVLDASSLRTIATLRTANTPTQMALAANNRYLMVANDNSQIVSVFNLDNLTPMQPVVLPFGHYARSIAAGRGAILAVARNVATWEKLNPKEPAAMIDRISLLTFTAAPQFAPPAGLGIYQNNLPVDSVMMPSPSGGSIFTAMADGTLLLYDDGYDTFAASRKDGDSLAGAFHVISDDLFSIGGVLYNRSLVRMRSLPGASTIAGMATADPSSVLAVSAVGDSAPGLVQTASTSTGTIYRPVKGTEAPITSASFQTPPVGQVGQSILPFLRTTARMADGTTFYLSTSGLTVLTPGFDNPTQPPVIASVGNLADGGAVAPGSLMRIYGEALSNGSAVAGSTPLPASLGQMCATVNGAALPLLSVHPDHVEAQLPFEISGTGSLIISTSNGRSAPFSFPVAATAPAVFRTGQSGGRTDLPAVYRAANNDLVAFSNPVHPKDVLIVIATGLGGTSNQPASGAAAPLAPLAVATTPPRISIGTNELEVTYAGLLPGQVGVYQINAVVPWSIPGATQAPLTITQGSATLTFPVRVVSP